MVNSNFDPILQVAPFQRYGVLNVENRKMVLFKFLGVKMFDNLISSNVEFMAQWTRIAVAIHYFIAISSSIFDSENTSGLTSRRFSYTPAPSPRI